MGMLWEDLKLAGRPGPLVQESPMSQSRIA
jgi:hypothetical protein